ncbi:unnamed protein product, partial [Ectocarpus sp. 4 AP-2014]
MYGLEILHFQVILQAKAPTMQLLHRFDPIFGCSNRNTASGNASNHSVRRRVHDSSHHSANTSPSTTYHLPSPHRNTLSCRQSGYIGGIVPTKTVLVHHSQRAIKVERVVHSTPLSQSVEANFLVILIDSDPFFCELSDSFPVGPALYRPPPSPRATHIYAFLSFHLTSGS